MHSSSYHPPTHGALAILQAPLALYIHKRNPFCAPFRSPQYRLFRLRKRQNRHPTAFSYHDGQPRRTFAGHGRHRRVALPIRRRRSTAARSWICGRDHRRHRRHHHRRRIATTLHDDHRHLDSHARTRHHSASVLRGVPRAPFDRSDSLHDPQRRHDRSGMVLDRSLFALRNQRPLLLRHGRLARLPRAARVRANHRRIFLKSDSGRPHGADRIDRCAHSGIDPIRFHEAFENRLQRRGRRKRKHPAASKSCFD